MIESVDRIVSTPIRECPPLVEGIISDGPIVQTAWFTIDDDGDDWFLVTDVKTATFMKSRGDAMVMWLKPEDMNDPVVQAELIVGLTQMGLEL